ncbi:hypothetical protein CAJAP_00507 [Camponotus japonicus]
MLETSRRSAISTSELGLYSDRSDRYNRNRYGLIVRKFAIGVMVVVTVILVAIFMYDFTSATSGNSKMNQETKHIYILQNALKKPPNFAKKSANSTILSEATMLHQADAFYMEDRSDDEKYDDFVQGNTTSDVMMDEANMMGGPEMRAQNLHNFKHRKRVLKSVEDTRENEEVETKQLFDNHAIVYRVRQRYKHPDMDEDMNMETRPMPFHWELKTPHPTSFKRPRYPQLSQYRYPQSSRNIQDIIKYLTNNVEVPNRGIKFTGVYMNPKKYDLTPTVGEMISNSDKFESEETSPYSIKSQHNNDPFYQYKPKHPADVNLLATSNVRFSPTGVHRYSPYYDPLYPRPMYSYNKPIITEPQYESINSYSTNTYTKNRKPKPFSVMLDIYPITDIMEQNKKTSWARPQGSTDNYDSRRPLQYNRMPKFHASSPQPIPLIAIPSPTTLSEEEEKQQMIFHLNLYPRKKSKLNRHDIIHRSKLMGTQERQQFTKKIMSPLESIAKHLTDHSAIEESKFENQNSETTSIPITRYHEMNLADKQKNGDLMLNNDSEIYSDPNDDDSGIVGDTTILSNHKLILDEDYTSTEKYEINAQKMIMSTEKNFVNCDNTTIIDDSKAEKKSIDFSKGIDATEGF